MTGRSRYKDKPLVKAKDRKAWRAWLQKHHATEGGAWLVIPHKGVDPKAPDYNAAVEEALCFGWIDSVKNKYDDHNAVQYFAPRKPRSNWSMSNHERVARLVKEGLMTPAGLAPIERAKQDGTWQALIPAQSAVVPDDLQRALNRNKAALKHFNAFPPSSKRIILEWIASARRPETRAKRIREAVEQAARNVRANHFRQ